MVIRTQGLAVLLASIGVNLCPGWLLADPIDPGGLPSSGQSPIGPPGTYTIDTSGNPATLYGPEGGVHSVIITADNVAVFVFDSITLPDGVILRATGTRPVALLSKSTFDLQPGAIIDLAGKWVAGEPQAGAGGQLHGAGVGAGTSGCASYAGENGGGGGFGGRGGNAGACGTGMPGVGGVSYGNLSVLLQGGSGGGGVIDSSGLKYYAGASGGALEIGAVGSITLAGTIDATGQSGYEASGLGGGSGGGVLVHGASVTLSGTINASGGSGGSETAAGNGGGGGGGAGRVVVLTPNGSVTTGPDFVVSLSGGMGGAPNGQLGASGAMNVGVLTPPLGPPVIQGCVQVSSAALVGAQVTYKNKKTVLQTTTDSTGCYIFRSPASGQTGTVSISMQTPK